MIKIGFLASHNGSAAHAITEACRSGALKGAATVLVSNNTKAGALDWAKDMGLKTAVVNTTTADDIDKAISDVFLDNYISLVVCSGYMKLIGPKTIASVKGDILNVHPALLPKYGGKGMYGKYVHQAVFRAKDVETGITIHLVDSEYDRGRIIAQKLIPVSSYDSMEMIEEKVKAAEPIFYIQTLQKILSGELSLK